MNPYLIQQAAGFRLDEIYRYTLNKWGEQQAEKYIRGLFAHFDKIVSTEALSQPIPAEFGVDGFFSHYQYHFIYWKPLSSGQVGITTVLHEKMHQIERFKDDFLLNQTKSANT